EELPHVHHYFRDPHDYFAKKLLVVGGRNSAVEAAVRCQRAGADVTLSHRGADFDPKSVKFWLLPEIRSRIRDDRVRYLPRTCPVEIGPGTVRLVSMDSGDEQIVAADFVLAMTGYRQATPLFDMLGVEMEGRDRKPRYDPETMETNVPGVFIAGTAIAGTPVERVSVIVETCHVHVPRIVGAITGRRVVPVEGPTDDRRPAAAGAARRARAGEAGREIVDHRRAGQRDAVWVRDRDRQDRDLVYLHERWRERLRHRRPERLSERGYSEKQKQQRESFHRPSESSVKPIILYSRRAPTFASHSVAPGATSQRSRPTMRFFARTSARSRPMASFHDRPP